MNLKKGKLARQVICAELNLHQMGLTSQVSAPENLASSGDHCQVSQHSKNNLAHIMPVSCRLPLRLIIDSMICEVFWCPTVQLVVTTEAMMTTTTNGTYLLHDKNGPGGAYSVGQPCAPLFLVQLQADMNVDVRSRRSEGQYQRNTRKQSCTLITN